MGLRHSLASENRREEGRETEVSEFKANRRESDSRQNSDKRNALSAWTLFDHPSDLDHSS